MGSDKPKKCEIDTASAWPLGPVSTPELRSGAPRPPDPAVLLLPIWVIVESRSHDQDRLLTRNIHTACYHCTKRRIVCDLTEPKCNKCAKKGLDCPGYGIRYRFADGKTASSTEFEPAQSSRNASSSSSASSLSAKRRQPDLKWVDVSSRVKRARPTAEQEPSAAAPLSSAARSSGEGLHVARRQQGTHASGPSGQYDNSRGHDHHYWSQQSRDTSPQETFESSSAGDNENDVIEITRRGDFGTLARPEFSPISITLPSLLSNPDPRIRLLFKHCEHCLCPSRHAGPAFKPPTDKRA